MFPNALYTIESQLLDDIAAEVCDFSTEYKSR